MSLLNQVVQLSYNGSVRIGKVLSVDEKNDRILVDTQDKGFRWFSGSKLESGIEVLSDNGVANTVPQSVTANSMPNVVR